MDNYSNFHHTLPLGYLNTMSPPKSVYIEAEPCLESRKYFHYFAHRWSNPNSILDCGMGLAPDLSRTQSFVPGDRDWAIKYLQVALHTQPGVIIAPDVLGMAAPTEVNFRLYAEVIGELKLGAYAPHLMYVIQGQNPNEAALQVHVAVNDDRATWIGFPRLVQYYGSHTADSENLASKRIAFIQSVMDRLEGKHVHMLGLNSLRELQFAAQHGFSIDSRIASLYGVNGLKISPPSLNRPPNLTIDLTIESFTTNTLELIAYNVKALDDMYHAARRD